VKYSLRNHLLTGIIGGLVLLLAVFSLLVYVLIYNALIKRFDTSLLSMARILAASVEIDNDEIELEFELQQMQEFQDTDHPTYYQLWRADGTVVVKSALLGEDNLFLPASRLDELVFGQSRGRNNQPQRSVGLRFIPRVSDSDSKDYKEPTSEQTLALVVVRDAGDLYSQLMFLKLVLLSASIAVITLSFLVAAFIVRRGLAPLNAIAAEISAIKEDDLTARINTNSIPTEIVPIGNRLNELLSRLEEAFERERRFTADVAHELRTPLAGLRSTIEVTLMRARDRHEYQAVISDCLAIVENMQKMVINLLTLARLETHQVAFRREQINLAKLASSCWRPFSKTALERKVTFENNIPNGTILFSDSDNLAIVISNLFDNAVEYTNETGRIWATAKKSEACVEITIANTGCTLTNEQVSQVFDSFWRADSSRSHTDVHSGLGLAIVQRVVRALGGAASVKVQKGGIFAVRLVLPAADVPQ